MDGERLESFNKFFTGGFKKEYVTDANGRFILDANGNKQVDWAATASSENNIHFYGHEDAYVKNVTKFLSEMSANQLGTLKTATLESFNDVLLAKYGTDNNNAEMKGGKLVSKHLTGALHTQIEQFNHERSMAGQRTAMNPAVREMLGIKDIL